MKLFPFTHLLAVIASILVLTASQNALADDRGHNRNARAHDTAGNQGRGHVANRDRHDSDRHFSGNRFPSNQHNFRGNYQGNYQGNYRYNRYSPRYSHDNWSVSLGFSNYGRYGTSLYTGVGYNVYSNRYGFSPYRSRTGTVVVDRPTVVYVNDSPPAVVRVTERPVNSLLRDIHGNCFERHYDSRGYETRIQLEDSACRF